MPEGSWEPLQFVFHLGQMSLRPVHLRLPGASLLIRLGQELCQDPMAPPVGGDGSKELIYRSPGCFACSRVRIKTKLPKDEATSPQ